MGRILIGTSEGLRTVADGRPGPPERIGWEDSPASVTVLARAEEDVLAVLGGHELWRSSGIGGWSHVAALPNREIHCLADTDAGVLVGTAEAHLDRVGDGGLQGVEGFERVAGRQGWSTPWGGPPATRSISEMDESIFVNVHVGGIPRTRDAGRTWEPTIDVDTDVHRVWAGPQGTFAACAFGLAVSEDLGDAWRIEDEGLHARYCRGVTVSGDTVLVSACEGPRGGRAAIYRRPASGGALERCREGLPGWIDGNVDSAWLDATPELAAFGTADGRVFASTDQGGSWSEAAAGLPRIHAILVMP